jgi:hypothetical protein
MASLEVPLANPIGSPRQVPSSFYYKIPVRPIYKSYPVYAPGHEPPRYIEWLKQQTPEILWDDKDHAPLLKTKSDWIAAGKTVFDSPIGYGGLFGGDPSDVLYLRDPKFYKDTKTPIAANGTVPFYRYVVMQKGQIAIGVLACAMCHTRVMSDGSVLKGAQGNFPFDRAFAYNYRYGAGTVDMARQLERALYAAPWIPGASLADDNRSIEDIASSHQVIPPGVIARHRSSTLTPVQVPDLIGVKDRRYLDRTGLQQNRSIVDIMRYAALNQGGDDLANYDGFIPADFPKFNKLPNVNDVNQRYSDTQLYALALYIYSLKPPRNPHKFDAPAS